MEVPRDFVNGHVADRVSGVCDAVDPGTGASYRAKRRAQQAAPGVVENRRNMVDGRH